MIYLNIEQFYNGNPLQFTTIYEEKIKYLLHIYNMHNISHNFS